MRDKFEHVGRKFDAVVIGLPFKDRIACFIFRYLQIGTQSPAKTRNQPLFNIRDFPRRTVAAEDNLLSILVQGVKNVEKLFLRFLLAAEKLYIIDNQYINLPVEHRKFTGAVIANGLDEFIGKTFRRDVQDRQLAAVFLFCLVADALYEVGLAQSGAAVNKKRIEGVAAGIISNGHRRRAGQPVAVAFNIPVKYIVIVQIGINFGFPDTGNDKGIFNFARTVF